MGCRRTRRRKKSRGLAARCSVSWGMKPSSASSSDGPWPRMASNWCHERHEWQCEVASGSEGTASLVRDDVASAFRMASNRAMSASRRSSAPEPSGRHTNSRGGCDHSGSSPPPIFSGAPCSTIAPASSSLSTRSVWILPSSHSLKVEPSGSFVAKVASGRLKWYTPDPLSGGSSKTERTAGRSSAEPEASIWSCTPPGCERWTDLADMERAAPSEVGNCTVFCRRLELMVGKPGARTRITPRSGCEAASASMSSDVPSAYVIKREPFARVSTSVPSARVVAIKPETGSVEDATATGGM
mmetsp:Transcript_3830/g.11328  ORF Transcript_3830/g.11328 Transcript_3830/m.11328 type:complete len:299 (-) Transcript_3830:2813-3709(-)